MKIIQYIILKLNATLLRIYSDLDPDHVRFNVGEKKNEIYINEIGKSAKLNYLHMNRRNRYHLYDRIGNDDDDCVTFILFSIFSDIKRSLQFIRKFQMK